MTPDQYWITVAVALVAAIGTYAWWRDLSPWVGCIVALTVGTVMHAAFACRFIVPFPHVCILIALFQYGLGAWASSYFPAQNPQYAVSDFPSYLSYAGPVSLALVLGWGVSLVGLRSVPWTAPSPRPALQLLAALDLLLWGGLGIRLVQSFGSFGAFDFFMLLLAQLRFLGTFGRMLLRAPGWKWRTVVVFTLEISAAVGGGMFHTLILWLASCLMIYFYVRRSAVHNVALSFVAVAVAVFFLHDAKYQIREATWSGIGRVNVFGTEVVLSTWNRPVVGGLCLLQSVTKAFHGGYTEDSMGDMFMRFNQGWIVDRVMRHVPEVEPYARGETIVGALKASVLPRVVAQDKHRGGGKEFMQRFAGYSLMEDASMNIGFAGEMYANFGYWGGILGCGIYALAFGLLFRLVAVRARKSTLWWAVAAYAGHWIFKAESDVGNVLNYTVKACVVVFMAAMVLPALRAELTGRALPARKLSKRVRHAKVKPAKAEQVPAADP